MQTTNITTYAAREAGQTTATAPINPYVARRMAAHQRVIDRKDGECMTSDPHGGYPTGDWMAYQTHCTGLVSIARPDGRVSTESNECFGRKFSTRYPTTASAVAAQTVSLNHPGGFCESFSDYESAEMALKNRAFEYEGESLDFFHEDASGDGWESRSFSYHNWQQKDTFAGKIVGPGGSIFPRG